MWQLYDELIDGIPSELTVEECVVGMHWIVVRSLGTGMAMTPLEGASHVPGAGRIVGMPLRDVAAWAKSWNFLEAAVGMAAINAYYNSRPALEAQFDLEGHRSLVDVNVFDLMPERVKGKKVTVIGHFPNLEGMQRVAQVSILERRPQAGDYPDPACEYILPEQDFVIMTGTTLINKTMPRLLELCRNAEVIVAGPTTPMSPILFNHGADLLGGLLVKEPEPLFRLMREGGRNQMTQGSTTMLNLSRADLASGVCS